MTNPIKDNEILRYYEAEMRYLRDAGREFADAFPDRARELGLDRGGERDPHVERLLEGFAFLMGRLRHKLDDELPELTEGLVSMLWPHYLRMIPSLSILELTPDMGALQKHETLGAGLEVTSGPIATGHTDGAPAHVEMRVPHDAADRSLPDHAHRRRRVGARRRSLGHPVAPGDSATSSA